MEENQQKLFICKHPLVQSKLSLLRDEGTDSKMFRELMKEIGLLLGYEATMDLSLEEKGTTGTTGYGTFTKHSIKENVALVPILRGGLGLIDVMLSLIPNAGILHLGIFRDKSTKKPVEYYNKLPNVCNYDCCIILDAMVATGGTCVAAITALKDWGAKKIKVLAAVGSSAGVQMVLKRHPDVQIYVAAVDEQLDDSGYIVPGLGDAGDRLFRTK